MGSASVASLLYAWQTGQRRAGISFPLTPELREGGKSLVTSRSLWCATGQAACICVIQSFHILDGAEVA